MRLILVANETSLTALKLTLQCHQKVRMPRKVILMIDPRHIRNVMRGATGVTLQGFQILCLPRKIDCQNTRQMYLKAARDLQGGRSENDPIRP